MRLRIIEIIADVNRNIHKHTPKYIRPTSTYVIQKKRFWGWSEVRSSDGVNENRISHKSYEDAEEYMFKNYMGHGECKINGNEYEYNSYTYYC